MGVLTMVNGPTVTAFIEDGDAFNRCVDEQFKVLDVNGDGVLSRSELKKGFDSLLSVANDTISTDDEIFQKFDSDQNGTIDLEEYRSQMKEIMVAVARGLGNLPVQVALGSGSYLMKAVQYESQMLVIEEKNNKGNFV